MSAPVDRDRPITSGVWGAERSIASVWSVLVSKTAAKWPDADSASRHGSSVASNVTRPTVRTESASRFQSTTSRAGGGFAGSPSALPELSQDQPFAIGAHGQVIRIIACQVPVTERIPVEIERFPPARLDVSLVAGRPSRARRSGHRRWPGRPGGPRVRPR